MSLVHEIFATEDLSAILTLAMLASLGLGAGVVWEEKHGPTPNENGFAAAVHSGALAALALVLTGPAVGQARGDFIDAALLPAGGTLYLLAVLIGGWASHRDSAGTLSDAVGRRGPKMTIALQGGIALGFGGIALGAAAAVSVFAGFAATLGVGITFFLVGRKTTAGFRDSAMKRMDRLAIHVFLSLAFVAAAVAGFWLLHGMSETADARLAILLAGYFLVWSVHFLLQIPGRLGGLNLAALAAFISGLAMFGMIAVGFNAAIGAIDNSDAILQHPDTAGNKIANSGEK